MGEGNGKRPVFDLSRCSRKWARDWQRVQTDFTEATAALETMGVEADAADESMTPEERAEVLRLMRLIDGASERQDTLVQQVLVTVPCDWVVPDATESHVDHILEDRWPDVIAALQEARAERSKN